MYFRLSCHCCILLRCEKNKEWCLWPLGTNFSPLFQNLDLKLSDWFCIVVDQILTWACRCNVHEKYSPIKYDMISHSWQSDYIIYRTLRICQSIQTALNREKTHSWETYSNKIWYNATNHSSALEEYASRYNLPEIERKRWWCREKRKNDAESLLDQSQSLVPVLGSCTWQNIVPSVHARVHTKCRPWFHT